MISWFTVSNSNIRITLSKVITVLLLLTLDRYEILDPVRVLRISYELLYYEIILSKQKLES